MGFLHQQLARLPGESWLIRGHPVWVSRLTSSPLRTCCPLTVLLLGNELVFRDTAAFAS